MQEWRKWLDSVSRSLHRYAALPDTEKRIFRFRCRTICMDQSFLATGKKEFSQEKEFKCLTSFTRPLGNKNPRTPECARAKTACDILFLPLGTESSSIAACARGEPGLPHVPSSSFYHFLPFLTPSEGVKDSLEHITCGQIIARWRSRDQFSQLTSYYKMKKKVRKTSLSLLILN